MLVKSGNGMIEILCRAPGRRKTARHQRRDAIADETSNLLKRQWRSAKIVEHAIRCHMQVRRTVDQGAIKVKNDSFHIFALDELIRRAV
jgi:hypothetical protein